MNLFLIAILFSCSSAIAGPKRQLNTLQKKPSYVWYDGEIQRKVWIDNEKIAEFDSQSEVKNVYKDAQKVDGQFGVTTIWKLGPSTSSVQASRSLRSQNKALKVSPVFTSGNEFSMRSLPGNVIIVFKKGWSEDRIQAWSQNQKIKILRKLEFTDNAYLIETDSGLASLQTANRLFETGEVEISQPDWWVQMVAK
jgi:hypothetical protein